MKISISLLKLKCVLQFQITQSILPLDLCTLNLCVHTFKYVSLLQEVRFCKSIRLYASALYMIQMILYTAVAVYAPALALSDGN